VGGVEPFLVHIEAVAVGFSAQVGLGQRRALIGPLGFLAEQQQAAVEALGAQGLGRLGAGQAGTDDHERRTGEHLSYLFESRRGQVAVRARAKSSCRER
jgi:hypothetical protein